MHATHLRTLAAALMLAAAATSVRAATRDAVMRRFAPLIWQQCHGRADYLTRFDYDGNWNGADNWEHLDHFPLPAYVYASAIESRTHWFMVYSFFHPRDWYPISIPHINHENDLEGALVVVEKAGPEADPPLHVIAMETIAHSKVLRWSSDPALAADQPDGPLRFDGERPLVAIKPWKHPAYAYDGHGITAEKGLIYRFKGKAELPRNDNDHDVGYDVLDLHETLWARRFEVGPDKTFGAAFDFPNGRYGSALNGDDYDRNSADAPWYWGHDDKLGLKHGEWFLNPAKAMRAHFPLARDRFSLEYVDNAYAGGSGR